MHHSESTRYYAAGPVALSQQHSLVLAAASAIEFAAHASKQKPLALYRAARAEAKSDRVTVVPVEHNGAWHHAKSCWMVCNFGEGAAVE